MVYLLRGEALICLGQHAKAQAALHRAGDLDPADRRVGELLDHISQRDETYDVSESALAKDAPHGN